MAFLDEAQVVGQPAAPAAQGKGGPFLSEAAVVGGSPAEIAGRQEASTWWGSLKAAAAPYLAAPEEIKRRASSIAGAFGQLADMSTGVGAGVVRGLAFSNLTVPLMLMGKSPKEAALVVKGIGDKIPEEVAAPFGKIAASLGPEAAAAYKQNPIGWAMEQVSSLVEKGGKKAESKAGIPAEMVEQAADLMFTGLGVAGFKGAYRSGRLYREAEKAKAAETAKPTAAPPAPEGVELVPPVARPDTFVEKPAQVKKVFDEAKARTDRFVPTQTDVADIFAEAKGGPAQAIAASQERIAAQKRALADTTKAEDVLAQRAPLKAVEESITSGEPLPPEAWLAAREAANKTPRPKEAPPQSDLARSGFWKISRGEQAKLTPEEYVATRGLLEQKGKIDPELFAIISGGAIGLAATVPAMQAVVNYFDPERTSGWARSIDRIRRRLGLDTKGIPGRPSTLYPAGDPLHEGDIDATPPVDDTPKIELPAAFVDAGLGAGVAGMVLGRKGMPHPGLVESLARPLKERVERNLPANATAEQYAAQQAIIPWADRAISRFLQKPKNEIADVDIPFGEGTKPLGEALDKALKAKQEAVAIRDGLPVREDVWSLAERNSTDPEARVMSQVGHLNAEAVKSYLSHVGDYLAEHVPAAKLGQYDLVRAVRETAKWDKELAKKMEDARLDDTKGSPVYKDYGDGMRWVQLTKPGQFARESDAMGHSVRGYEPPAEGSMDRHMAPGDVGRPFREAHPDWIPASGDSGHPSYGLGGWEAIKSGEAKIYSLRDAKGESHATIEVKAEGTPRNVADKGWLEGEKAAPEILQIKGKQNRAPAERYLPYVQDFVKGGKWGEVGDLENTHLIRVGEAGRGQPEMYTPRTTGLKEGLYTHEEIEAARDKLNGVSRAQQGKIDPKLLAGLAAVSGGAALGAYLDPEHPIHGAILGAGAGAIATRINPRAIGESLKQLAEKRPLVKIDDIARETVYVRRVVERETYKVSSAVERAVPDVARREAIWRHLDGDETIKLSPTEAKAAADVRAFYAAAGAEAKRAGVVRELIDDYATRIYGEGARDWIRGKVVGGDTSLESPFGKKRAYPTLAEAQAAGHEPLTLDISRVMEAYSRSVTNAIENKKFVQTLKAAEAPDGTRLVAKEGKAPSDYVFIDHPQLRGLRVNPDIAADLRFIFDAKEVGPIIRTLDAINTTQKRMAVSFSLFHAAALEHAMLGATPFLKSPGRGVKILAQSFAPAIFGENLAVKMVREGGAGDLVDQAMKAGVQFGLERQSPALQELKSGFYEGMQSATKFLDDTVPQLGTQTVGRFVKLNHMFDRAMWGRFHTAMKLETFADKVAELSRNNARAVEAGKAELKSQEEIGRMAASFTNDVFGGLDWHGLVQEFDSRWGRELASAMFSPSGRLGMRMMLFAPDWTISTTRAFAKAFGQRGAAGIAGAVAGSQLDPEHALVGAVLGGAAGYGAGRAAGLKETAGSGVGGLVRPQELADLHRQYLMRSALIYSVVVDALNVQMSGHHFWENKDPTRLDRGDGTTQQVSKHFMEPMHWLISPRQQAMNKLSFVVKEPLAQLQDVEYLSTRGAPRMGKVDKEEPVPLGARVKHVLKGFDPISVQQSWEGSAEKGVAGFLGAPIYGKTYEERQRLIEDLRAKRQTPEWQERARKRKEEKAR